MSNSKSSAQQLTNKFSSGAIGFTIYLRFGTFLSRPSPHTGEIPFAAVLCIAKAFLFSFLIFGAAARMLAHFCTGFYCFYNNIKYIWIFLQIHVAFRFNTPFLTVFILCKQSTWRCTCVSSDYNEFISTLNSTHKTFKRTNESKSVSPQPGGEWRTRFGAFTLKLPPKL